MIDKQALLDALDTIQPLAVVHAENMGNWSSAIASYLQRHATILLVEAQQTLKMPLVGLWMEALLSGQVNLEQRGSFYQTNSVWLVNQWFTCVL